MSENKGIFITLEGPEGAGKTTQIKLLSHYFEELGRECLVTREPGGTGICEKLREILKHHIGAEPVYDETELLLFEACRAQITRHVIIPALDAGKIVISDRYYDSTTAYQGYARGFDLDFVKKLNTFAVSGHKPDITFLLDLPVEAGFERTGSRDETSDREDRIESEARHFHRKVRNGFLRIAEREPERVKIISAIEAPEVVHSRILEYIRNAF
jgi:dTMP kinase